MRFVQLTNSDAEGSAIWINLHHICALLPIGGPGEEGAKHTRVMEVGSKENYYNVKETPSEIFAKLRQLEIFESSH